MDVSATPAIIAITAAVAGVLLAPRALHAPPPVVREPTVREAPAPTSPVLVASRGHGHWRLEVTADGTALWLGKWRHEPVQELRIEGPIEPALVARVRALHARAGEVTLSSSPSCLRGPNHRPADDFVSAAAVEDHAEAAAIARAILDDFGRRAVLADHALLVAARRTAHAAETSSTYEVEEILHAADGTRPPAPGTTFVIADSAVARPVGERLVATVWREGSTDRWAVVGDDPDADRKHLAWLEAHPVRHAPIAVPGVPSPPAAP